jgi:purine-binding chemotaxis protein CheW
MMKMVTFFLNEESYAVPMADLTEVNRMAGIRIVPKAPEYVMGLLNLHGTTAPVLNLKRVLRLTPWQPAPHCMWIAVRHHGLSVCLTVDKLGRIVELPRHGLDETPALTKGVETRYLKCCARIEDAIVPVLAVDHLLGETEREALAELLNDRR